MWLIIQICSISHLLFRFTSLSLWRLLTPPDSLSSTTSPLFVWRITFSLERRQGVMSGIKPQNKHSLVNSRAGAERCGALCYVLLFQCITEHLTEKRARPTFAHELILYSWSQSLKVNIKSIWNKRMWWFLFTRICVDYIAQFKRFHVKVSS